MSNEIKLGDGLAGSVAEGASHHGLHSLRETELVLLQFKDGPGNCTLYM